MKKTPKTDQSDDLRPDYDFSALGKPVRGKYAKRYRKGTNLVLLEPDVAEAFPDDASVNEALRFLLRVTREQRPAAG